MIYPDRSFSADYVPTVNTIKWMPTCSCDNHGTSKCIVLDPFMGAGTTAIVSEKLGRDWIGIELSPKYVQLSYDRIKKELGVRK